MWCALTEAAWICKAPVEGCRGRVWGCAEDAEVKQPVPVVPSGPEAVCIPGGPAHVDHLFLLDLDQFASGLLSTCCVPAGTVLNTFHELTYIAPKNPIE